MGVSVRGRVSIWRRKRCKQKKTFRKTQLGGRHAEWCVPVQRLQSRRTSAWWKARVSSREAVVQSSLTNGYVRSDRHRPWPHKRDFCGVRSLPCWTIATACRPIRPYASNCGIVSDASHRRESLLFKTFVNACSHVIRRESTSNSVRFFIFYAFEPLYSVMQIIILGFFCEIKFCVVVCVIFVAALYRSEH